MTASTGRSSTLSAVFRPVYSSSHYVRPVISSTAGKPPKQRLSGWCLKLCLHSSWLSKPHTVTVCRRGYSSGQPAGQLILQQHRRTTKVALRLAAEAVSGLGQALRGALDGAQWSCSNLLQPMWQASQWGAHVVRHHRDVGGTRLGC